MIMIKIILLIHTRFSYLCLNKPAMVLIKVTNGSFVVSMNTDREDRLWLETLKSIFPDARNLVYTSNKSETVALSVRNEKIFNEDGWDPNILYLVYNGLQKTTSVDQGVIISTPPPTISKVATKVFNECSNRVYRVYGEICSNVTTTNDQQKQSVSQQIGSGVQYREKRILTSAHLKFFLGNEYDIWNNGITLKATCIYINKSLDFAILESDSLPKTGFSTGILSGGYKFVILGYPEKSNYDNLSVSDGTIEGVHEDGYHLLGTIGSRHSFSGALVFSKLSYLAGIVIEGKSGLVNDSGTQTSVKILPMSVIYAALASIESSKDSL